MNATESIGRKVTAKITNGAITGKLVGVENDHLAIEVDRHYPVRFVPLSAVQNLAAYS